MELKVGDYAKITDGYGSNYYVATPEDIVHIDNIIYPAIYFTIVLGKNVGVKYIAHWTRFQKIEFKNEL